MNITLPLYDGYSVVVSKENIMRFFPESLLGRAIDLDPGVDNIDILNNQITPAVLDLLRDMINEERLPSTLSDINKTNIINSTNYLNIDALSLFNDPYLNKLMRENPDINLLDINHLNDRSMYNRILTFIVVNDDLILAEYLFFGILCLVYILKWTPLNLNLQFIMILEN